MKARVKETGDIIDVEHIVHTFSDGRKVERYETEDAIYVADDLDFDVNEKSFPKDEPDYWEKLKHQYAGMAMQGILANCNHQLWEREANSEGVAKQSYEFATALVNRFKKEEK